MPLTQARLKELLTYDPITGVFTWRTRPSYRTAPGDAAGSLAKQGYICIQVEGRKYKAHRLAWLYMTGEWPEHDIDHRDENKANNRWRNLRPATRSQNMLNKSRRSDNTSGIKGVSWDRRRGLWQAQLQIQGRKIHVGHFTDKRGAEMAIRNARTHHHGEFANHGGRRMKLIGLVGKARVGKDTAALRLCEKYNFHQYAFATPVKDMLTVAFGDHFHRGDREKPLAWLGKSPRQLMQTLGTEWGRNLIHPDLWTLLAEHRVKAAQWINVNMVISDVRFHNEADMILRHGGELWHILRDNAEPAASHSSEEYDWSGYTQRQIIHNNGTIDELHAAIDALL